METRRGMPYALIKRNVRPPTSLSRRCRAKCFRHIRYQAILRETVFFFKEMRSCLGSTQIFEKKLVIYEFYAVGINQFKL